jgi:anti-sigma B factor antagonist
MAVSDLTVRTARIDERTRLVALAGELDLYSADAFRAGLDDALEEGVTRLVVDLGSVEFIDSVALGVLANAMKRVRAAGGGLGVVSSNQQIVRVFEITGLDRLIVIAPTLADALERL